MTKMNYYYVSYLQPKFTIVSTACELCDIDFRKRKR